MKNIILSFLLLFWMMPLSGQNTTPCADKTKLNTQVLVMPWTMEHQDIRTVLDSSFDLRVALTKVKEAFENRGLRVKGFEETLKSAKMADVLTGDNQADLKSTLVQFANTDIVVEVEFLFYKNPGSNNVKINLTAFESSTALSLSSKTAVSNQNNSNDVGLHVIGAMEKIADDFMNTMTIGFNDIIENGKPVLVNVSLDKNSSNNFDSEIASVSGKELSLIIEDWISDHAVKGNYSPPNVSSNKMVFPEVRIQLLNPVDCKRYSSNRYAKELSNYLKTLNINSNSKSIGNSLFITIL